MIILISDNNGITVMILWHDIQQVVSMFFGTQLAPAHGSYYYGNSSFTYTQNEIY